MAEVWKDKTTLPEIGTTVVVKYTAGSERPYGIIEVKNATVQQQIADDVTIEYWQDISYFLNTATYPSNNVLSGFKEGENNDWAPTVKGYIQTEYDVYMLRQQINARVQTLPNEVDNFDGIDYMNVIFGSTSVEQKAAAFVEVIQNIPAVKGVTFINASWVDKQNGVFKFTFNIQSIFGDLQFQIGLDAQNQKVIAEN